MDDAMATSVWSRVMAGARAFREAYLSADVAEAGSQGDQFSLPDARRTRYGVLWSFYENTAYREIHTWAKAMKVDFALYQYVRNIYNPAYRIGDFWETYLWGGALDSDAGNGEIVASALPIETKFEPLRPAIAQLWRWSNWATQKDVIALWGTVLGDVGLRVVDDTVRGKVYLERVHPAVIEDVTLDPWGNVKGYVIEEQRPHPDKPTQQVAYREECTRDGQEVVFRTLLNRQLYPWNGQAAEWSEPYGFVPLVLIQHRGVGLDWGWSEVHPALGKIREVDDLASKLSDQIRKTVDVAWLFTGVQKPVADLAVGATQRSTSNPEPARQEVPALWGPQGADAKPLVAPLDIEGTLKAIAGILQELERDYPELRADIASSSGDASGRALRVARQRVDAKALKRRAHYDDGLARAQMMAIAIGGMRGYEKFAGYGLESYAKGELNHAIGSRPVFAVDQVERLEQEGLLWQAAGAATKAGIPLEMFLKRNGWSEKQLAEYLGSAERQARVAGLEAARLGLSTLRDAEGSTADGQDSRIGADGSGGSDGSAEFEE